VVLGKWVFRNVPLTEQPERPGREYVRRSRSHSVAPAVIVIDSALTDTTTTRDERNRPHSHSD